MDTSSSAPPTDGTDAETLTVYADYVCPFCYLGHESLAQYIADREAPLAVDWRPFDLRRGKRRPDGSIDHGVDDGKDDEYFEQARQNVRRLQAEYDVEMSQELAVEVDSLPAQLASHVVKTEHPAQWADFDDAIYKALWVEGRDIGDLEVLCSLADDVGLSGDIVRTALEDDARRKRLEEGFQAAQERGVTGVPTFVYGEHVARGAVPPAHLRRLVEGVNE